MKARANTKRKSFKVPRLLAVIIVALLIALLIYGFRYHKSSTFIPSTNPNRTSAQASSSNSSNSTMPKNASSSQNSGTTAKQQASAPTTNGTLVAPYGEFVSNHAPGQNGSSTSEESTCITTPGAQCYIQFTNGTAVKRLNSESTDSSGAAYWKWNADMSSGSWTITAIASINGQTKTTKDPQALIIEP